MGTAISEIQHRSRKLTRVALSTCGGKPAINAPRQPSGIGRAFVCYSCVSGSEPRYEFGFSVACHHQHIHGTGHRHVKQLGFFFDLLPLVRHISESWNGDDREFETLTAV